MDSRSSSPFFRQKRTESLFSIQNKLKIDVDQVENLNWGPPETIGVDFEQVFFSTDYSDIKGLLPKQFQSDDVVTEIDEAIDRKLSLIHI